MGIRLVSETYSRSLKALGQGGNNTDHIAQEIKQRTRKRKRQKTNIALFSCVRNFRFRASGLVDLADFHYGCPSARIEQQPLGRTVCSHGQGACISIAAHDNIQYLGNNHSHLIKIGNGQQLLGIAEHISTSSKNRLCYDLNLDNKPTTPRKSLIANLVDL